MTDPDDMVALICERSGLSASTAQLGCAITDAYLDRAGPLPLTCSAALVNWIFAWLSELGNKLDIDNGQIFATTFADLVFVKSVADPALRRGIASALGAVATLHRNLGTFPKREA